MNLLSSAQMRKIHVLAKEQGLDNDTLHAFVFATVKKQSLKDLTIMEAVKIIDSLEGKEKTISGMMTSKQKELIYNLLKEIGWTDERGKASTERFLAFVKAQYQIEHEKWITTKIASKIIECFKQMKARQNKKEANA